MLVLRVPEPHNESRIMLRTKVRTLSVFVGAGLVLAGAARITLPRVAAAVRAHAPAAQDPNQPVIRFVKDPEMAPALEATDILGRTVTKDNWPGKVVMVNFWATWCPPCREEIPELLALKRDYQGRVEIVGISEDDDGPETVLKFARQKGMNYPIVMATPELVASYGGVPALPTTFLIDTQGRVVTKHSGLYPIEYYHREIRALLGLPNDARVETFVDTGQLFIRNAANATELPGVDFTGLTPEQKKKALRQMNSEGCTCGCKLTISQCRVNDTGCPVSQDRAAAIVKEASGGDKPVRTPTAKGAKSIAQ
jgi:thiol-disulfide isomerase/thioredoxin